MLSVSIVVPSYQGSAKLQLLLTALEAQQTSCDWEVVVALDGSTDGSRELLDAWRDRVPLVVIDRGENRGRAFTLNEGFAHASKAILVRCDDDLEPAPNYIELFSSLLTADPTIGVVGLYKNNYPSTAYSKAYGTIVDRRFAAEAYQSDPARQWHYWGGNCAVTRETFNLVGNYDENFRQYGYEDVDWGYRLAALGRRVVLEPRLETTHNVAATTTAGRCQRARWSGEASVRFNLKHGLTNPAKDSSLWNSLVDFTASFAGKGLGNFIDFLLPALPSGVALRLVDLAVQAAHQRGVNEATKAK